MADPQSDSPIALRVRAFVRVQSNPNIDFVCVPPLDEGRIRLLYVVCRPGGTGDVSLRAVANRLLQDLGPDLAPFEITALRPPTFERLQSVLTDAKAAGRPFHIVHFDGHGVYEDLSQTTLADWLKTLNLLTLGGPRSGKHGYLLFEHPTSREKMRPVPGDALGKLLHDTGVPVLALNACQSAMHEASARPASVTDVHDAVRATPALALRATAGASVGSLAQAVVDQGIPAVLGMRYSVYVATASQYIGQLYANLAKGRSFGEAASEGRKHLARNPERWVGLEPRPLQDWFVPVVYEAAPIHLLPPSAAAAGGGLALGRQAELDPVQSNPALRRYVPDTGFIGRDETLLLLDRAFDSASVVLLHAYAGQGKTATAVEFSRWYAMTGGLGPQPVVLLTSFEQPTDLPDALNQVGGLFNPLLQANGIEWHALNDLAARRSLVVQLLRRIPLLWIWDNVEPVAGFPAGSESQWTAGEQAELADFLKQITLDRATRAKLLLTSRRDEQGWLGGVPRRVLMPRMSRADAASLAVEIGRERGLERRDVNAWEPLLDYCAGNPLTLRIIAGQAVRMGFRTRRQIAGFVQAVRDGEQAIQDVDAAQGRDRSLGASLDYGFRSAFRTDELPVIALLHLFQGTVDVMALCLMGMEGRKREALPELANRTVEQLVDPLERACDVGLLTDIGSLDGFNDYIIHPALSWYLRQLFVRHYDGLAGRSTDEAALRAWIDAMCALSDVYHYQFIEAEQNLPRFLQFLGREEANLLHARRIARRHGWWSNVTHAMQSLQIFYKHYGRRADWARLVSEITPDFCTPDDAPIPGREDAYIQVMEYRVDVAMDYYKDLTAAALWQEKVVSWYHQQVIRAVTSASGVPVDRDQHSRIRAVGVSLKRLGDILREQDNSDCVRQYEEAIGFYQRIGDSDREAQVHLSLGHAYKDVSAIRNLDAAEAAYQRSLTLGNPNDKLFRSTVFHQIGTVDHERFREARQRGDQWAMLTHMIRADKNYQQAIALCPPDALTHLGPSHLMLGSFYTETGRIEPAREHLERAVRYFEKADNTHDAGRARYRIGLMYLDAAGRERTPARRRDLLRRGLAYAQASLRDFQSYQGCAAADEADAQRLIDGIARALG